MKRPVVGDEMVLVGHRGDRVLVRVTKVGRKYFGVEALDPKDSWMCPGDVGCTSTSNWLARMHEPRPVAHHVDRRRLTTKHAVSN
jgi:hypothetical protein